MKKYILARATALVMAVIMVAAFTACGGTTAPASSTSPSQSATSTTHSESIGPSSLPPPEAEMVNTAGNTPGNILNKGLAAIQGDWIYFISNSAIWKVKTDGTEEQQIYVADGNPFYESLNIVGEWIIFKTAGMVYKVQTDGTDFQEVIAETATGLMSYSFVNMQVVGDWIYYIGATDNETAAIIYKCKTDGTERTVLLEEDGTAGIASIASIMVWDGWVYYVYQTEIWKIRTDGADNTQLFVLDTTRSGPMVRAIGVDNKWIYYTTSSYEQGVTRLEICKMKLDGTEQQQIYSGMDYLTDINVADGWVYYVVQNDGLYKIRTDGTEEQLVAADGAMRFINIVGSTIYFSHETGNGRAMGRVGTDGDNMQML